jgi:hypothetical protein
MATTTEEPIVPVEPVPEPEPTEAAADDKPAAKATKAKKAKEPKAKKPSAPRKPPSHPPYEEVFYNYFKFNHQFCFYLGIQIIETDLCLYYCRWLRMRL